MRGWSEFASNSLVRKFLIENIMLFLGIQSFAEAHSCLDLQQKARTFALKHFNDLIPGEEFEAIPESQLVDLISR